MSYFSAELAWPKDTIQVLDLDQLWPKPQGMILTSCDNDWDPECYGFDPVYYLGMTMPSSQPMSHWTAHGQMVTSLAEQWREIIIRENVIMNIVNLLSGFCYKNAPCEITEGQKTFPEKNMHYLSGHS